MIWRSAALIMVVGCGSDTVNPGSQNFGEFSDWAGGIEGFTGAPTGTVDTGGTTGAVTTYDGAYAGTYTVNISYGGNVCTFSNVTLQVLIADGLLTTPFLNTATSNCTINGSSGDYNAQMDFYGSVSSDTTIAGTFSEDYLFTFEGGWNGYVTDLGAGAYQISATFNESVNTVFPGGLATVSGSFILDKQ
jgi:hypothetical protein